MLELVRGGSEDALCVGDIRIGGVSPIAIWPETAYDSEVRVVWRCAAGDKQVTLCGKPGVVARYGDSLREDWDGLPTECAEWAILEIGDTDIMPQLALLEGEHVVLEIEYDPHPYGHSDFPKDDYEAAALHAGQWAACRQERCAGSGSGRISVHRCDGLYSTGIFAWRDIAPEYGQQEARYECFADVRWADSEEHARRLCSEWIGELVNQGRQAQAEHDEIVRLHRSVMFTDAGGAPYIGTIIAGTYPHKPVTVRWYWYWSPVGALPNPIIDPIGLALLSADPSENQLQTLGELAKTASDSVLAATTAEAQKHEWARAGCWPFWTVNDVRSAIEIVGLSLVDLPRCWGTEPSMYVAEGGNDD
jgi:hypothetical protein